MEDQPLDEEESQALHDELNLLLVTDQAKADAAEMLDKLALLPRENQVEIVSELLLSHRAFKAALESGMLQSTQSTRPH